MSRDLDHKARVDLEWATLCERIARECMGPRGAARILALAPAERGDAEQAMARSRDALEALGLGQPLPAADVPEIGEPLARVARQGTLNGEELRAVASMLGVAGELRAFVRAHRERLPALCRVIDSDPALERVRADIVRSIEPSGRVADEASKELARARQRARSARGELHDRLRELCRKYAAVLRDQGPVERDGRYGLPVRADARGRVPGLVLGSSDSGATLYVEPPAVTRLTGELKLAEGDVEREVERVLGELSRRLGEHHQALAAADEACVQADVLAAIARWARARRASAIFAGDAPRLSLSRMRHPLLDDGVVPSDIVLEAGRALILSGPNAGGKTVALKCLGLAALMVRSGLPLPADPESEVGWFEQVLTDIGDEQSIERSLSSFSAEVELLSRMLAAAGGRTLILLDELCGGTDPEEGAALAVAVLEALVGRGAAVATTTHYERLKELGASDSRFDNASVGFDFDRMQPTFALTLGVPGPSSALYVARRHGLEAELVERARGLLGVATRRREELLGELAREHQELIAARQRAEEDAAAIERLRAEMETERREVRAKERDRLAREASALTARIREARDQLRAVERLAGDKGAREASRAIDEAARVVSIGSELDRATRQPVDAPPATALDLSVGARVYVPRLGAVAAIVEPPERGQVLVQAGVFSLRVPVASLLLDAPAGKRKQPRPERPRRPDPPATDARVIRTSEGTCDLRGLGIDEARARLDRFVDAMVRSGETAGFALHGHGTGALKKAVREHLAASGQIRGHRPATQDEGGDAFTVFWI